MNGISHEKVQSEGKSVDDIEAFFSGFPRIVPKLASSFPNIRKLCIVGQEEVTVIEHISTLSKLEELWVVECRLKVNIRHS